MDGTARIVGASGRTVRWAGPCSHHAEIDRPCLTHVTRRGRLDDGRLLHGIHAMGEIGESRMHEISLSMMSGYGLVLTALVGCLALLIAQVALSISGRVAETQGLQRGAWVLVGSLCLGGGIWSMHLGSAFAALDSEVWRLRPLEVALPAGVSIAAAAFLLSVLATSWAPWARVLTASLLAGPAFAAAYFGMLPSAGIPKPLLIDPALIFGGMAAWTLGLLATLAIAVHLERGAARPRRWWRAANGGIFLAVFGALHYVGIALSRAMASIPIQGRSGLALTWQSAVAVSVGSMVVLLLCLFAAAVDRRVRHRRAETEALRRSEDRFRSLVQASAQIVWTTAPDGQMLGEQRSWAEFTGQPINAYQGWGWFNAIHPEDRERTARLWEETLAHRRSAEVEHRVHRHDGQYRECIARIVPVLEPDGRVREWVGTHTDVTDRARMQEERDLLAEAGRVLSSSLDYRETLGAVTRLIVPRVADWCAVDLRSADGSLHRLIAAHVDPHRAELLRAMKAYPLRDEGEHGVARVMRTGESELIRQVTDEVLDELSQDTEHRRFLAQVGLRSLLCVPLTARGQVLGVLSLALAQEGEFYDLRDLALAEELARRSATAIDNARLYSDAQEAIGAREEVLGIVSHDLRNPLSTIAMSADLLLDLDLSPEERRRHLEIIRRCAMGMNRLIRDLLDVSQSDHGKLAVERQPTDPGSVIAETVEQMQPLAAQKSQCLTQRAASDLPPILADQARLQQVLSNLIGNAFKFVEPGGAIHVQADRGADEVRFSVMDTGPGIAAEDQPHLFDRHWRAKDTAHLGAGLGLAISKGIVEAHGGRIWVQSEPGRGTCFHFTVPLAPTANSGTDSTARARAVAAPEQSPGVRSG